MAVSPERYAKLAALIDLRSGIGLEIGPLDRPFAARESANVRYVDIRSAEHLRAHYAHDPAVDCDAIPEIDFPIYDEDGNGRSLAEAARSGAPYDWVVASHVVEHVPDLIAWLSDIASLLRDDGVLALVVPDRRSSFDAIRPQTTVGQMLQANADRDTVPSVRAVYDHFNMAVEVKTTEMWAGYSAEGQRRIHNRDDARALMEHVRTAREYVDCHVWTFTPASFVEQILELNEIGYCDFVVDRLRPTDPDELEFFVTLRRLPVQASTEEREAARNAGRALADELAPAMLSAPRLILSDDEAKLILAKRRVRLTATRIRSNPLLAQLKIGERLRPRRRFADLKARLGTKHAGSA